MGILALSTAEYDEAILTCVQCGNRMNVSDIIAKGDFEYSGPARPPYIKKVYSCKCPKCSKHYTLEMLQAPIEIYVSPANDQYGPWEGNDITVINANKKKRRSSHAKKGKGKQ